MKKTWTYGSSVVLVALVLLVGAYISGLRGGAEQTAAPASGVQGGVPGGYYSSVPGVPTHGQPGDIYMGSNGDFYALVRDPYSPNDPHAGAWLNLGREPQGCSSCPPETRITGGVPPMQVGGHPTTPARDCNKDNSCGGGISP